MKMDFSPGRGWTGMEFSIQCTECKAQGFSRCEEKGAMNFIWQGFAVNN